MSPSVDITLGFPISILTVENNLYLFLMTTGITGALDFTAIITIPGSKSFILRSLPLVPSGNIPKILPSFKILRAVLIALISGLPLLTGKAPHLLIMGPISLLSNSSFFAIKYILRFKMTAIIKGSNREMWLEYNMHLPVSGTFSRP